MSQIGNAFTRSTPAFSIGYVLFFEKVHNQAVPCGQCGGVAHFEDPRGTLARALDCHSGLDERVPRASRAVDTLAERDALNGLGEIGESPRHFRSSLSELPLLSLELSVLSTQISPPSLLSPRDPLGNQIDNTLKL